jgi:hypothetical protein
MVHIMAPATKKMKFAAYEALDLAVENLTEMQYAELNQEQHPLNDWNRIILAINTGRFDNELEYEYIKKRKRKKSAFIQSFTPRESVKFIMEGPTAVVQEVKLEASVDIQSLLKPHRPVAEGTAHVLTGNAWEAICTHVQYVQMLNTKLPELQEIMSNSEEAITERLTAVEDELGAALTGLGTGEGVPGEPYVNVWRGIGTALENNQPVATIVGKIAHQVKLNATAVDRANQENTESGNLKTQFVGVYQSQNRKS